MSDFIPPELPPEAHCPSRDEPTPAHSKPSIGEEAQDSRDQRPNPDGQVLKPSADYAADISGIYLVKSVPKTPGRGAKESSEYETTKIRLTNFLAIIKGQRLFDDGEGDEHVRREYIIEAATAGGGTRFTLSADQFSDIRRWIDTYIGAPAALLPSVQNHVDHVLAAIKFISGTPPTVHIRTHPGWVEVAGARGFLHQGGMIGSTILGQVGTVATASRHVEWPTATQCSGDTSGSCGPIGPFSGAVHSPISYQTDLPLQLRKFNLPSPLVGDELKAGFEAVYELVNAASSAVGFSLLGSCFSAPLGGSKTYVNLIGSTDSGKSVYAGLFQSFYGPLMDAKNFPAHWGATANFLERLLYHAKDVMVVIDDFLTKGQLSEVQRQQAKADQVLRALFNNNGRGRAQGDGEIRAEKPPRAQVVCTAELPFDGLSIKNRGFNLDFQRTELDWDAITNAQENARRGVFAGVMSSFLSYMAGHYDQIQIWRSKRQEELERLARSELPGRGRAAAVVASLAVGVEAFFLFGHVAGILNKDELAEGLHLGWNALITAARAQEVEQDDPVEFFFMCLQTAFVTGRAHLKGPEGGCPIKQGDWSTDPDAWGWHRWTTEDQIKTFGEEDGSVTTQTVAATSGWRPKGETIGWMNGTTLYLHPAASLKAAKAIAKGLDTTIDFTAWTLGKTLYERGLLLKSERNRNRYTARENLGGGRPNVLFVGWSNVMPPKSQYPSECRLYDCEDHEIADVIKSFEGLIA